MNLFGSFIAHDDLTGMTSAERNGHIARAESVCCKLSGLDVASIVPVQVTAKTVCLFGLYNHSVVFLKLHLDSTSYLGELFFYKTFGALPLIPKVLLHNDDMRILVLERVGDSTFKRDYETTSWLFGALGVIHGHWEQLQNTARMHQITFSSFCERSSAGQSLRDDCENTILDAFRTAGGKEYEPISLGDLKPTHLLSDGARRWLVDFDSVAIGRWEPFDLVMALARFDIDLDRQTEPLLAIYERFRVATGSRLSGLRALSDEFRQLASAVRQHFPEMCSLLV